MNDMMIDIETLGTGDSAVITQIGACFFDRYTGEIGETFCVNISIASNLQLNREVDAGALKFWLENRHSITWLKEPVELSKALAKLNQFYQTTKKAQVWSHTFDQVILANAYRQLGSYSPPWGYRNGRDIRTLVDLSELEFDKAKAKTGKTHNGLDDCIYQVEYCTRAFNILREKFNAS